MAGLLLKIIFLSSRLNEGALKSIKRDAASLSLARARRLSLSWRLDLFSALLTVEAVESSEVERTPLTFTSFSISRTSLCLLLPHPMLLDNWLSQCEGGGRRKRLVCLPHGAESEGLLLAVSSLFLPAFPSIWCSYFHSCKLNGHTVGKRGCQF